MSESRLPPELIQALKAGSVTSPSELRAKQARLLDRLAREGAPTASDTVIVRLERLGLPLTRANYVRLSGLVEPLGPEHEAALREAGIDDERHETEEDGARAGAIRALKAKQYAELLRGDVARKTDTSPPVPNSVGETCLSGRVASVAYLDDHRPSDPMRPAIAAIEEFLSKYCLPQTTSRAEQLEPGGSPVLRADQPLLENLPPSAAHPESEDREPQDLLSSLPSP